MLSCKEWRIEQSRIINNAAESLVNTLESKGWRFHSLIPIHATTPEMETESPVVLTFWRDRYDPRRLKNRIAGYHREAMDG